MIESTHGDILQANVDALVNPINCVGVMGKGLALQFKTTYPDMFAAYKRACDAGEVVPGKMFITDVSDEEMTTSTQYIINFPTKRHWRSKSRLEDIDAGLLDLIGQVHALDITTIAIPPIGCGHGGLDWDDVKPRIITAFDTTPDTHVLLFEPSA